MHEEGERIMKKFSLVIPVFQTPGILKLFLESLETTLEYESQIIFIDDASPKESQKLLFDFKDKNQHHDITIITHKICKGCVYNINKGYADFKQIIILSQNDEYSIVASNTDYGLSMYDYIVLDAKVVNENDFIYE